MSQCHDVTIPQRYDLVLRGGELIDGSGAARSRADVAVCDDRIAYIGRLHRPDAARILDISGKIICPGFIDVHTHDDRACIDTPAMRPKTSQGVTTVVVGNCGLSLAPLTGAGSLPEPLNLLGEEAAFEFGNFQDYVDAVKQAKPAVNVRALTGHSTLRVAVMRELDKKATARELDSMLKLLDDALDAGAAGLSSGVFYPTGAAADMEELAALAGLVGEQQGVYAVHLRDEYDQVLEAMQEAVETARTGRVPMVISHHKCAGVQNWGRTAETLALLDTASQQQAINIDCYPYTAGSSVLAPELVDGRIKILVTWSAAQPELGGRYLDDIAAHWRCSQQQAAERLMPGGACYFQMHEDDVRRVLQHPSCMVGSDGLPNDPRPHPRLWGTFPRVLGHYVRDEGLLPLETAIHKMSGLSASVFNIPARGLVRPGAYADLVVFDAEKIRDNATYEAPCVAASGIDHVLVNGDFVLEQGEETGRRAGRFITHKGAPAGASLTCC